MAHVLALPLAAAGLLGPSLQVEAPMEASVEVPEGVPAEAAPLIQREGAEPTARERKLLARIRDLEAELRRVEAQRLRQNQEWIAFTKLLSDYSPSLPEPPEFIAEALEPEHDPLAEAEARQHALAVERGQSVQASLRSLLMADGIRNLDFLEVGVPRKLEGRSVVGPAIARVLDDRGRMIGMIKAERMRLEASRSTRSVTLVLEDGYESRRGKKTPFEGGVRRIFLSPVEPDHWIEALPDLVDKQSLELVIDDGRWDLVSVRAQLARLLSEGAREGASSWRLVGLGGVRDGELRDIQFGEVAAGSGSISRRVFADAGRVRAREDGGIEIVLTSGTVRRGDRTSPFLDGRFRLILPYANVEDWKRAQLPGLSMPPESEAAEPGK